MKDYYYALKGVIFEVPQGKWKKPLKLSIYTACFLEVRPWKAKVAFSLAHGAITKGISERTIEIMTSTVSIRTIRIQKYLKLAALVNKLQSFKIEDGLIQDMINISLSLNYSVYGTEGMSLIYLQLRHQKFDHDKSFLKARSLSQSFKNKRDRISVFKEVSLVIDTLTKQKSEKRIFPVYTTDLKQNHTDDNLSDTIWQVALEKFEFNDDELIETKFSKWDHNKLKKFVKNWLNTPYKWGGTTKSGIDCSGFVLKAIYSQFPQVRLPRSASMLSELGDKVDIDEFKARGYGFF